MEQDKRNPKSSSAPADFPVRNSELEGLYRGVQPEMHRPKPSPDALAAALEAAQRLAAEADAEQAADDTAQELTNDSVTVVCQTCGYRNRTGNKFCSMCGNAVLGLESGYRPPAENRSPALALPANPFPDPESEPHQRASRSPGSGNASLPSPLSSPLFPRSTGWNRSQGGRRFSPRGATTRTAAHGGAERRHEPGRGRRAAGDARVGAGVQHQAP